MFDTIKNLFRGELGLEKQKFATASEINQILKSSYFLKYLKWHMDNCNLVSKNILLKDAVFMIPLIQNAIDSTNRILKELEKIKAGEKENKKTLLGTAYAILTILETLKQNYITGFATKLENVGEMTRIERILKNNITYEKRLLEGFGYKTIE